MQYDTDTQAIGPETTLNLICTKCTTVIEINHQTLGLTFREIFKMTDFEPHEETIQMFGICNHCRKQEQSR